MSIARVGVKDGDRLIYAESPRSVEDELKYTDDLEQRIGALMQQIENGPRAERSSSQAKEEYHRLHEWNVSSRKGYRFEMQDELKGQREGRILHMNRFLGMLKETGLNCWYTPKGGMPKTLGLFAMHAVGTARQSTCTHAPNDPHYVCFVQVPFMQEYEELFFDRYDVPLGIKRRGWRTVLLKLIEAGLVTEEDAHRVFGEPVTGPTSRRYRAYLQYLRNNK